MANCNSISDLAADNEILERCLSSTRLALSWPYVVQLYNLDEGLHLSIVILI